MFGIPPPTQDRFSMGWTLMCICIWPKSSHPGLYWPSERKGYHHTVDTRNQNPAVDNDKHILFLYHGEKGKHDNYIIKHTYIYTSNRWCRNSSHKYLFFVDPLKTMGEDSPHIGAWWLQPATRLRRSLRSACGSKQSKTWSCGSRKPVEGVGGLQCWGKNALSDNDATYLNKCTSWWFEPIWKNISQNGSFPQIGVKIQDIWNHHLDVSIIVYRYLHIFYTYIYICMKTNKPRHDTHELGANEAQHDARFLWGISNSQWKKYCKYLQYKSCDFWRICFQEVTIVGAVLMQQERLWILWQACPRQKHKTFERWEQGALIPESKTIQKHAFLKSPCKKESR